jgi:hypothetical protein
MRTPRHVKPRAASLGWMDSKLEKR